MADPPPVMSSARYGPFAAFLPPIVDQGLEGVCAFASTSQYLKFIVSRQFVLNPAELDGWLPHQWLMEQMLAVPGNTYGLSRNAETGDCPTSPITILRFLRDHLGVVPSPQGPLIFPPIHTLRSVQNVQNIDGGVHGDEEAEVEVFKPLDVIWIQVTQNIDMFGSILGELEAVDEQLKHHKKPGAGVFVSRKGPGRTRRGKMIGHSVLVTGHNGTQGGRRYLEVQNTFGPEWGGAGDGYGKIGFTCFYRFTFLSGDIVLQQ